jgi:hypothetical protein
LRSHRTTARALLFLLLLGLYAGTAQAASVPDVVAFPVVGNVTFTDDYADPRPQGWHQGNDIMGRRHQPAVAFERGRVQKHVSPGHCMLYLHGASGMTYVYIHLNNDETARNDNTGGCRNGIAYAPGLQSGDHVRRGQLVGYVGDSGDANGIQPHLHFEIRTPSGSPINPYRHLLRAKHLLYPRPGRIDPVRLTLRKAEVLEIGNDRIKVRTAVILLWPNGWRYRYQRRVVLAVPPDAVVERRTGDGPSGASLTAAAEGKTARVWTKSFDPSWRTQRPRAGTLAVRRILIGEPG